MDCNAGSSIATTRFGTTYGAYVPIQLSPGAEFIISINGIVSDQEDTVTISIDRNDSITCSGTILD